MLGLCALVILGDLDVAIAQPAPRERIVRPFDRGADVASKLDAGRRMLDEPAHILVFRYHAHCLRSLLREIPNCLDLLHAIGFARRRPGRLKIHRLEIIDRNITVVLAISADELGAHLGDRRLVVELRVPVIVRARITREAFDSGIGVIVNNGIFENRAHDRPEGAIKLILGCYLFNVGDPDRETDANIDRAMGRPMIDVAVGPAGFVHYVDAEIWEIGDLCRHLARCPKCFEVCEVGLLLQPGQDVVADEQRIGVVRGVDISRRDARLIVHGTTRIRVSVVQPSASWWLALTSQSPRSGSSPSGPIVMMSNWSGTTEYSTSRTSSSVR